LPPPSMPMASCTPLAACSTADPGDPTGVGRVETIGWLRDVQGASTRYNSDVGRTHRHTACAVREGEAAAAEVRHCNARRFDPGRGTLRSLACILVLFRLTTACAAEDPEARVVRLIDGLRPPDSRSRYEVSFEQAPAPPRHPDSSPAVVECEFERLDLVQKRGFVQLRPEGDRVEVLAAVVVVWDTAMAGDVAGDPEVPSPPMHVSQPCAVTRGSLTRAALEDFLTATSLVSRATLVPRITPVPPGEVERPRRLILGDVWIRVGDLGTGAGVLSPEAYFARSPDLWESKRPLSLVTDSIDERARAYLCTSLMDGLLEEAGMAPCALPDAMLSDLSTGLASLEDRRRGVRVTLLGWLGGARELEAIRDLPSGPLVTRAVRQIRTRILLESGEGLDDLRAMFEGRDDTLRTWAREELRSRFKDAYKRMLLEYYRRTTVPEVRDSIRHEFEHVDPDDLQLARLVMETGDLRSRVAAAKRLDRWELIFTVARDKSLVADDPFYARSLAISYLGTVPVELRERAGGLLLGTLRDETDDIDLRGDAAQAVGRLGFHEAAPTLLRMLERGGPALAISLREGGRRIARDDIRYELMMDLRFDLAVGLGWLRAKEAVPCLEELLRHGIEEDRLGGDSLAAAAGWALAHIGTRSSRSLLQRALDAAPSEARSTWERRVSLLEAIASGSARAIAVEAARGTYLTVTGPKGDCRRYWVELLAEVCGLEDLEAMAAEPSGKRWASVVEEALERRKAG